MFSLIICNFLVIPRCCWSQSPCCVLAHSEVYTHLWRSCALPEVRPGTPIDPQSVPECGKLRWTRAKRKRNGQPWHVGRWAEIPKERNNTNNDEIWRDLEIPGPWILGFWSQPGHIEPRIREIHGRSRVHLGLYE